MVGSSISEHWQGAILEAIQGHNYRFLNITRTGTVFSTQYDENNLKGIWNQNVLEYLEDADVDLIISPSTRSDSATDKEHKHMVDQLKHVKNEFDIDVLALRDVPRYSFNVLESLENYGVEQTIKKMNQENNQKDDAVWKNFENTNSSFYKLDLSDYFMVDGQFKPIIGNVVILRDNRHLTNSISKSFGSIFEKELVKILSE